MTLGSTDRTRSALFICVVATILWLSWSAPASARRFTLESRGPAPEQAFGLIRFRFLGSPAPDVNRVKMRFTAENLPRRHGQVYNLWFVDKESGQLLNLGAFDTNQNGNAEFAAVFQIGTFDYFDSVRVTSEPTNDPNPGGNGPMVLEGITPLAPRHQP